MSTYHESIIVDAPPEVVYRYWTRFEEYPAFMSDVAEVRRLGEGRLAWRGHGAGGGDRWETVLIEEIPGQSIAWRSTGHPRLSKSVQLIDLGRGRTRVNVTYTREREQGDVGELLLGMFGFEPATLRANLEQFKRHVELQELIAASGERAVGATRDGGAAVARGEAPGPGPATGLAEARGAAPGGAPAFGAGMSKPGAVTAAPEPPPPGFTGNRGTASAPASGAGVDQRGGGTGGMGGGGSAGDDTGTGGTSSGLGTGNTGGGAAPPRRRPPRRQPAAHGRRRGQPGPRRRPRDDRRQHGRRPGRHGRRHLRRQPRERRGPRPRRRHAQRPRRRHDRRHGPDRRRRDRRGRRGGRAQSAVAPRAATRGSPPRRGGRQG